jgi:hypothetical protein
MRRHSVFHKNSDGLPSFCEGQQLALELSEELKKTNPELLEEIKVLILRLESFLVL